MNFSKATEAMASWSHKWLDGERVKGQNGTIENDLDLSDSEHESVASIGSNIILECMCRDTEHKEDQKKARSFCACKCTSPDNTAQLPQKEKLEINGHTNFNKICGVPALAEVQEHLSDDESFTSWLSEEHPGIPKIPAVCPICMES